MLSSPVVVGGTGGSGTRVLAAILCAAGVNMGTKVNANGDALAFRSFNRRWIIPYLQHRRDQRAVLDYAEMVTHFRHCLAEHRASSTDPHRRWGWKRPEAIYLLPFLHQQLPDMLFIHVLRNGLDMAFSSNQNDLLRYELFFLERRFRYEPVPLRSLRLWHKSNVAVADYAAQQRNLRYFRIHFETLCAQPQKSIADLFQFLQLPAEPQASARHVTPQKTVGRWRENQDSELLVRLLQAGKPALKHFGYWEEEPYRNLLTRLGPFRRSLLPAKTVISRTHYFLARLTRAVRERRLLAAFRNRLPEGLR